MRIDGAVAQAQTFGNLLRRYVLDHEFQYFAFSLSEEVKCFFKIPAGKFAAAFGDRLHQAVFVNGFFKKFGCTRLQRRNGEINVGMSCKDDDGQGVPAAAHFHLQLCASHVRHADVENKAARHRWCVIHKERPCTSISANLPAGVGEHHFTSFTKIFVVINDAHERVLLNILECSCHEEPPGRGRMMCISRPLSARALK